MISLILSVLWILCLCPNAQVQSQPDAETLTLEQCIALALEQNPLLQSSQQFYQASLARIHRAKAFAQPNLDFDSDLQPELFDFNGSRESYIGLSQNIDFPGKRSTRGKIAARESSEIQADAELLKLDIAYQVNEVFYRLLLAEQILQYAEQDLELSRDYLQKAEIKHEAGDVAKVEVLRARVETAKAENSVRGAVNEVRLGKARLNFLLARKKYEPLEIAGEFQKQSLRLSLDELKQKAMAFRPEIKRLGFSLEKEDLRKTLGKLSYLPDLSLGFSRHSLSGVPTTWDFTVSFPIPLFFWQPQKGEIAEAQANLEALRREKEHLINAIALEVEEAYANALMTRNQIELFEKEILSQAEEAYNMWRTLNWPALLIILNIPSTLIGGILALLLVGETVNVSSTIGLIALFGICVQNDVILVAKINDLRRKGLALQEAVVEGAVTKFRPIFMTDIVMIVSVLPLALIVTTGAELHRPLAVVYIGGFFFAIFLRPFIVPILYETLAKLKE